MAQTNPGFRRVAAIARTLHGVELTTRYDGTPVLQHAGCFMAGPARHPSAEPGSLVIKIDPEERHWLLEEPPDTYYVTDYYRPHPVVLVRLQRLDPVAMKDLLSMSWRAMSRKARP